MDKHTNIYIDVAMDITITNIHITNMLTTTITITIINTITNTNTSNINVTNYFFPILSQALLSILLPILINTMDPFLDTSKWLK